MSLPDKRISIQEAVNQIPDGATIMIGGFGVPGTPFCLIQELAQRGVRELTIIKNDANEIGMGVDWLLKNAQVRSLIASHIGLNPRAISMMNKGDLTVEFVPQGILAERIRCQGAGLMGFISDIGVGTNMFGNLEKVTLDERPGLIHKSLQSDFALIHCAKADTFGNLVFSQAARNFNPLMAMAARVSIVEAEEIVEVGVLKPDQIHLPGAFVDHLVLLPKTLPESYHVINR